MAVSVDAVYKTVLLILNKEQRGYMTPNEFNKIATQVQREIFERYFEDLNQQVRSIQTDMEYSDRVAITDEKLEIFKRVSSLTGGNPFTLPNDFYRLGSVTYSSANSIPVEIQKLGRAEYYNIIKSPLTSPSESYPIYLYEENNIIVSPSSIDQNVELQYIKKPSDVVWGYAIDPVSEAFLWDGSTPTPAGPYYPGSSANPVSVDFELHNSEQTEIIINVLLYAGIVIRDPQIIQAAASKIQQEEVNEKQ